MSLTRCCSNPLLLLNPLRRCSRMLKKSASAEKVDVKAEAKAEMKKVRSSLNLDLDLSLVHSLRTGEVLACHNSFSTIC
jgi:hypothetical protein